MKKNNAVKNKKIEIIRCVSIILVIYIHNASEVQSSINSNTPAWFGNMIYIVSGIIGRVAVPAMFMISGYLLARKKVNLCENFKKKTRSLLIPYFLWNTIWILIYGFAIKAGILNNTGKNVLEYSLIEIVNCYTGHLTGSPFVYPLWFLRDLYLMQCVIPLFQRYFDTWIWNGVVLGTGLTYFLGFPIEGLFMFVLGIWIYNHRNVIEDIKRIPNIIVFIIFIANALFEIIVFNSILNSAIRSAAILTGLLLLYRFAELIEDKCSDPFVKAAPYTMFIYCGHQYTLLLIRHVCARLWDQNILVRTSEYFFIPPVLFLALLFCGFMMNKHLKPVYLLLSGGR